MQTEQVRKACVDQIISVLTDAFAVELSPASCQSLMNITINLLRIWKKTQLQRAIFHFEMSVPDKFEEMNMVDAYGLEEPDFQGQKVSLVLFPCLLKQGDERGENVSQMPSPDHIRLC